MAGEIRKRERRFKTDLGARASSPAEGALPLGGLRLLFTLR